MTDYLTFVDVTPEGRKTAIVDVRSTRSGINLGQIRWFGRWRQYAFYPDDETIWNPDCLEAVNARIRKLMAARRTEQHPLGPDDSRRADADQD